MKKMILALTTLAIAGTSVQTASAGGGGWSTAGKVLAGVTAGVVIGQALAPRPVYYAAPVPVYYPAPGYGYAYSYASVAQPAVVYAAPAPVVYAAPRPVVVYRAPVFVAPPLVSVGFGYYGGYRPYCYHRGHW
jgi:hypothetical protein